MTLKRLPNKNLAQTIISAVALAGTWLNNPALAQQSDFATNFNSGIQALQSNNGEAAEKMLSSAAEQAQKFGDSDPRYFQTLDALALAQTFHKNYPEAEKTYQRVISLKGKALGPDALEAALSMGQYADLLLMEGKYKQAESVYKISLKIVGPTRADYYTEKAQNLGICLTEQGHYSEAEQVLLDARKKEEVLNGHNSIQPLTVSLNLANLYIKMGSYGQAEKLANETLHTVQATQAPTSKLIDACLAALESVSVRLAHYSKAEEYARELVRRSEISASAAKTADYARSLERLANVYKEEQKYGEAEKLLEQARAILEKLLPGHPYVADCLLDQAELMIAQGKYSAADKLLKQALKIRERELGKEHSDVAECLIDIAYIESQQNKPTDAEATYRRAIDIKLKTVGLEHPDYAKALDQLGMLYVSLHRNGEAEAALTETLRLREKILPPEHPDIARTMAQLAGFYKDAKMSSQAEALYRKLLARDQKYEPQNAAAKASDLNNLAVVLNMMGKADASSRLADEATTLRKSTPGGQSNPTDTAFIKASQGSASAVTDKWCLCIGISNFKDTSINLKYAAKDATDFQNFMLANGNFKPDHVKLLTDEEATRENILEQLGDKWLGHCAKPTDLVVIYISSHGSQAMQQASGTNFLVAYDTNKNSLLATGIPMQWLSEMVKEQVHSDRILLILDVCHSGAATGSDATVGTSADTADQTTSAGGKGLGRAPSADLNKITAGAGQVILCSSAADQVSWESKEYPNSVFTKRLIEAMRHDGPATPLTTAYKLMKDNVEAEVLRDRSATQTPMIKENWQGGALMPLMVIPSK